MINSTNLQKASLPESPNYMNRINNNDYFGFTNARIAKLNINSLSDKDYFDFFYPKGYIIVSLFQAQDTSKYNDKSEWLDDMAKRTSEMQKFLKQSGYYYTQVLAEYSYGPLTPTNPPVKQINYIIFNYKFASKNQPLDEFLDFGKKICAKNQQSIFLYVPREEDSVFQDQAFSCAYIVGSDGKYRDIITSENIISDIDNFLSYQSKYQEANLASAYSGNYLNGFLYFFKETGGVAGHYMRRGEAYCGKINYTHEG